MKKKSQELKVGFFVLCAIICAMVIIFFLGGGSNWFESHYRVKARFIEVSGLGSGSSVHLAGVQIGVVESVHFSENPNDRSLEVVFKLQKKFKEKIRRDSKISISTQGLLGDKSAFITIGSASEPVVEEWEYIQTQNSFSLDQLAEKGREFVDQAKSLMENTNQVVNDLRTQKSLVHALLYDPKGAQVVDHVLGLAAQSEQVVKDIRRGNGLVGQLIYEKSDPELNKKISTTVSNFKNVSDDIHVMTSRIKNGEGSIGGLLADPTVYYDLKTLLGKANRSKLIKAVIRYTLSKNEKETLN